MDTTIIIGGLGLNAVDLASVEYFGPLNITIKPLLYAVYGNTVIYVDGILYNCGGTPSNGDCYKYGLNVHSPYWVTFTSIPGSSDDNPGVAFSDFFWLFNDEIREVGLTIGRVTSYDWGLGHHGRAVGNGSHTVLIEKATSLVLLNSDPSTPTEWTVAARLKTPVSWCGCLWLGNTIYVTGGWGASDNGTDTTQLIDTDTFEVTLGAPLPFAMWDHGMGVIDGLPAVIGGYTTGYILLSSIYVYDSGTNTWTLSDQSLSEARAAFGAVTF